MTDDLFLVVWVAPSGNGKDDSAGSCIEINDMEDEGVTVSTEESEVDESYAESLSLSAIPLSDPDDNCRWYTSCPSIGESSDGLAQSRLKRSSSSLSLLRLALPCFSKPNDDRSCSA